MMAGDLGNCQKDNKGEKKPIIALKAGRSAACAKAVMSHTGALLGSDQIYDALFTQSGVIFSRYYS